MADLDVYKKMMNESLEKIHNLLWNDSGLEPNIAMETMYMFIALRIIEPQVDKLELPEICKWSYLKKEGEKVPGGEHMLDSGIMNAINALRKNEKTKRFFEPRKLDTAEKTKQLFDEIDKIDETALSKTDVLGDLHEYMMGRGMSIMADEGQYFTPRAICRLATKLCLEIKNQIRRDDGTLCTFADLFCGTGGFTLEYVRQISEKAKKEGIPVDWATDKSSIYSIDKGLTALRTTILNFLIHTGELCDPSHVCSRNSFQTPIVRGEQAVFKDQTFDYMLENPPYGGDKNKDEISKFKYFIKTGSGKKGAKTYKVNEEIQTIGIEENSKVSAAVQLTMSVLSENGGIAAMVLPQGFFFGTTPATMVTLRKKLAEELKIHFVVDTPSGVFTNTGTKTSIIIFQRGVGPTELIKFIDPYEKVLATATLEELRARNYSLSYNSYATQGNYTAEGFEMVQLGDICKYLQKPGKLQRKDAKNTGKYRFYTCSSQIFRIDDCEFSKLCLIINRGGLPNIRIDDKFSISHDDIYVMSSDNEHADAMLKYIYYYIKMNIHLLGNIMHGTVLKHLSKTALSSIQIPLPSIERQKEIAESIDIWAQLVHGEEEQIKIAERCAMLAVYEMGRGKPTVKLGDICEFISGKSLTKENIIEGNIPVVGGGIKPMGYHNTHNSEPFNIIISQVGSAGYISRYDSHVWITNNGASLKGKSDLIDDDYFYYSLKSMEKIIQRCAEGTAQPKLSRISFLCLTIPLPIISEQLSLRQLFDDIRHRYKMLRYFESKMNEAIDKFIPKIEQPAIDNNENNIDDIIEEVVGDETDEAEPSGDNPEVGPSGDDPEAGPSDDGPVAEQVDYQKMTVATLKQLCKENGIKGYTKLKKVELIKRLQE